jgi:hypothetical protein
MNDFLTIKFTAVDYTVSAVDQYIGATAGNITITLPTGILGRFYQIKNQSSGNIKVQGTGGELVDGSIFKTLTPAAGFMVVFDGTIWKIL